MPKYEIMLVIDPKSDIKVAEELAKSVFAGGVKKIEKLDRTELAYPINNSTTATFLIMDIDTDAQNIKEFTRKVNIQKSIWRNLAVNLDAEEGKRNKSAIAAKKAAERKPFERRSFNRGPRPDNRRPRPDSRGPKPEFKPTNKEAK